MAESFGADAERYDRARPRYPDALVRADRRRQPRSRRPRRRLRHRHRRPAVPGGRLHGARGRARRADGRPRAAQRASRSRWRRFEAWDPAGRTFDAVVAGQAWHWVDPVAGAAKAARVLRPGGRLAVFWNVVPAPARGGGGLRRGLPAGAARLAVQPPAAMPVLDGVLGDASPGPPTGSGQAGAFGEPEQWRFDWERTYTRDEWLDQLPTFGGHSRLPPDTLASCWRASGAADRRDGRQLHDARTPRWRSPPGNRSHGRESTACM